MFVVFHHWRLKQKRSKLDLFLIIKSDQSTCSAERRLRVSRRRAWGMLPSRRSPGATPRLLARPWNRRLCRAGTPSPPGRARRAAAVPPPSAVGARPTRRPMFSPQAGPQPSRRRPASWLRRPAADRPRVSRVSVQRTTSMSSWNDRTARSAVPSPPCSKQCWNQ